MRSIKSTAFTMSIFFAITFQAFTVHAKRNQPEPTKMTKQSGLPIPAAVNNPAAVTADASATEIKYVITSNPSEEKFENVTILKSRNLISGENSTELKSVNYGLRKKAIFGLVPVRVYTAQLFVAHPEKLVKSEDGFLASLKEAGPVQMRLTFLRDLPGQKIADSFKEGLEANKINTRSLSTELSNVMTEVAGIKKFSKDDSFSITAIWNNNQASLLLEDSIQIKTFTGSADLAENILSIWFGKSADSKLSDLKKELIK